MAEDRDDPNDANADAAATTTGATPCADARTDAAALHAGAASGAPSGAALPPLEKIVIAIHGIGSQRRSDTIRSVARRFGDEEQPPVPLLPLGFFSLGKAGEVCVSRLDVAPASPLARIGFAEVFWADIPREVVKSDDTLEDTKAWGATVVSRAEAAYLRLHPQAAGRELERADFALAAGVIDEIVETVSVLENLLSVFEKMGVFKFDLAPLLRDTIGDVQVVTEFKYHRERILARLHGAMAQIVERYTRQYPGRTPEIHLVAHSEGTVVSFLGLLQALAGVPVVDPDTGQGVDTGWVRHVRGFMTLGSPIDKHLVLWGKLWEGLALDCTREPGGAVVFRDAAGAERLRLPRPIAWRNYYDLGDPIGFELETARQWLCAHGCHAFDFEAEHDIGFGRYLLPGKAHTDYWNDPEVFGHFIADVVLPQPQRPPREPRTRPLASAAATALPYVLAAVLHLAGVFILFKAINGFLAPQDAAARLTLPDVVLGVGVLGLLLYASTVCARIPRLVRTRLWPAGGGLQALRWHLGCVAIFGAAAALTAWLLPGWLADFLGIPLARLFSLLLPSEQVLVGKAALLLAAAGVAASGWFAPRRPRWGRRTLLVCGLLMVAAMISGHLLRAESGAPVWPLVLAGLAFIYLWWLGMTLFDLAFVWHRYIRRSIAQKAMARWQCEAAGAPPAAPAGAPDPLRRAA